MVSVDGHDGSDDDREPLWQKWVEVIQAGSSLDFSSCSEVGEFRRQLRALYNCKSSDG